MSGSGDSKVQLTEVLPKQGLVYQEVIHVHLTFRIGTLIIMHYSGVCVCVYVCVCLCACVLNDQLCNLM